MTEPERATPVYRRVLRGMFTRREFFWWWLPCSCFLLLLYLAPTWLVQAGWPRQEAETYALFGHGFLTFVLIIVRTIADHWPLHGKADANLHTNG